MSSILGWLKWYISDDCIIRLLRRGKDFILHKNFTLAEDDSSNTRIEAKNKISAAFAGNAVIIRESIRDGIGVRRTFDSNGNASK